MRRISVVILLAFFIIIPNVCFAQVDRDIDNDDVWDADKGVVESLPLRFP